MKKNGGFSLVELVVVIAIISVVTAGSVMIFLSLSDYKCRTAADQICTYLGITKTEALAKSSAYLTIENVGGEYKITPSFKDNKEVKSLGKSIKISYVTEAGGVSGTETALSPGDKIILTFSRGSGAFAPMKSDLSGTDITTPGGEYVYCKELHIQNAKGTKGYTITLEQETGKYICKKD